MVNDVEHLLMRLRASFMSSLKIQLVNIITTITNHTHRYRKQVSGSPWGKGMKMDDIWVGV